jgi:CMP/dCMP kinase
MACRVVCISAADGAAGEEIGTLVASRLGFRLVNEQIVARAAEQAGVEGHVVAGVEQRRSLVRRVLDELPAAAASASPLVLAPPTITDPIPAEHLRGLIRSAIEETASRGEAVILSHAASHALATRADTLRVLVTAAPDTRRARIKAAREVTEKEAGKLLTRGDAHRADYFKRFYHVPAELPTHYDIVVNSDRLSVEQAADIILQAASSAPASA